MDEVATAAAGQDVALESGQEGAEVTEVQETATEGLDTPPGEGEPASGQEEEAEEAAEGQEEAPKKGDKKTFEERMAEIESKIEAKLVAKLQADKPQEVEKPDFTEVDYGKVNEHIRDTMDRIEELKLEGNYLEAMELQDGLTALRQELKTNEQKKAAWIQRTQAQQQSAQVSAQINEQIARASELVAKENNIPADVWKKGEEFFLQERTTKPLIDAQYREMVLTQGPVRALLWAKDYVEKNMGKGAQADQQAKNEAKQKLVTASGAITIGGKQVSTWAQLMELPSSEINKFNRENPKQFKRLKDAHFK